MKELAEFPIMPSRERYCRIIKKITNTTEDRINLWREVLKRVNNDDNFITTGLITDVWNDMIGNDPARMVNNNGDNAVKVATGSSPARGARPLVGRPSSAGRKRHHTISTPTSVNYIVASAKGPRSHQRSDSITLPTVVDPSGLNRTLPSFRDSFDSLEENNNRHHPYQDKTPTSLLGIYRRRLTQENSRHRASSISSILSSASEKPSPSYSGNISRTGSFESFTGSIFGSRASVDSTNGTQNPPRKESLGIEGNFNSLITLAEAATKVESPTATVPGQVISPPDPRVPKIRSSVPAQDQQMQQKQVQIEAESSEKPPATDTLASKKSLEFLLNA